MAKWRVCYKRSMHDKWSRGYKPRDYFSFFTDDYLEADYCAFLEYQEPNELGWKIFCRILKGRYGTNFHLIDADGQNILPDPSHRLSQTLFTIYLKNLNPSPYDFCCAILARPDFKALYKK